MNLYAVKGKKGEIYIRIEATDIEIKGTGELKTIKIPILKFLELEEKLDELLFGENNSIRVKHLNRIVPLIGKEEIHELLFHVPYTDGYPITKAFSMKVELEITRRIETSNPMTYEEIIDLMSKTLGTGRNWSENTWLGTLSDKIKTEKTQARKFVPFSLPVSTETTVDRTGTFV